MTSQAGDLASSFVFVNHAFRGGLLKNGNSVGKALLGLLQGVAGYRIVDFLNNVFGPGFVIFISHAPHFALPSTFKR
jgi:hypothetical protein